MNTATYTSLGLVNVGGAEIILILAVFIVLVVVLGIGGLCYLIYLTSRPAQDVPAMPAVPPDMAMLLQQRRDQDHIKLLAIFHFVFAGMGLLGIGFLGVHYAIMQTVFSRPEMFKSPQQMPPQQVLHLFVFFYLGMGFVFLTAMALNVVSGLFLLKKRSRIYSMVIAGLNCLQIPFGTTLGVFTLVVLSRDSVRRLYGEIR
jgi:hypothetical protein